MKYTLFGESHGSKIGIVLERVPSGLILDLESIRQDMIRRSAKFFSGLSTSRHESDEVEIISGVLNNTTTGAPLCAEILNNNIRSGDYNNIKLIPRPSHADYAAFVRFNGFNDIRGGGHFSGRLTAPLVFAGNIAKQILAKRNIEVFARIKEINNVCDMEFDKVKPDIQLLRQIKDKTFPVIDDLKVKDMQDEIFMAKSENDSVGGIIECFVTGFEAGHGSNSFDDNLESLLAKAVFAVPAVKGIEFGLGFSLARMRGSQANDQFQIINDQVFCKTNNNGGINGGISNGMPINFSVVIKPTPSIGTIQDSIDLSAKKDEKLVIGGRHDPCIVPRAVVVIEAVTAIALTTLFEERYV